jgi:hypothetical protein
MASELKTCVPGRGRIAPLLTVVNGTLMARMPGRCSVPGAKPCDSKVGGVCRSLLA